ncbi:unnamed protein product, partial [Leptosia nina]
MVQEQYTRAGLPGLLQQDVSAKAGILVLRRTAILRMNHLTTSHCSVAQVELRTGLVYLVSAYFQYSDDIQPHIRHLERVLEALKGEPVIIAVDTNTHSSLWHSREEQLRGRGRTAEERREALEAFILAKGLTVNNLEGEPETFCSPNGASNIDATLSTRSVKIGDWRVHEDVSTSDHRLITFAVLGGGTRLGGGAECGRGACEVSRPRCGLG